MRKNNAQTPHDLVFKTFLSRMETARDFIAIHLPPALLRLCDLQTLQLESGSFIEEDLRPYFSDMLYSLKTSCGDGYIHVLKRITDNCAGKLHASGGRGTGCPYIAV